MWTKRGFTLIELLVTLAILAILVSVAVPIYTSQVQKGKRSAAQQFMLDVANREEQYILDANSYTDLAGLGLSVPAEVAEVYTVTVSTPSTTPPSYTITATPKAGTRMAGTATLTLNSLGQKTPADAW